MSIKIVLSAAIVTAAVVVVGLQEPRTASAHEVATKEDLAEINARLDVIESRLNGNTAAVSNIYDLVENLKARLDAGEVVWNQNHAVDDLYAILDAIVDVMNSQPEQSGPAIRE